MTRWSDEGSEQARNGEPFGELGLIRQSDHGHWQTQTGGPTDPQAGNIPGRPPRHAARRRTSTTARCRASRPTPARSRSSRASCKVTAADSTGRRRGRLVLRRLQDASTTSSPRRSRWTSRPAGGRRTRTSSSTTSARWTSSSPASTSRRTRSSSATATRLGLGRRSRRASVPGGVKAGTFYDLNVVVNGLVVTVTIDGKNAFSYTFAPRIIGRRSGRAQQGPRRLRLRPGARAGSTTSRSPSSRPRSRSTAPTTSRARDGAAAPTDRQRAHGRHTSTADALRGHRDRRLGSRPPRRRRRRRRRCRPSTRSRYVELEATFRAVGTTGFMFDWYSAPTTSSWRWMSRGSASSSATSSGGVRVIDRSIARALTAGADYLLNIVLKATVVTVTLGGQVLASVVYNAPLGRRQTGSVRPRRRDRRLDRRLPDEDRRRRVPRRRRRRLQTVSIADVA